MPTNKLDIVIAIVIALIVGVSLALVVETVAFGDVHIDSFIASYE